MSTPLANRTLHASSVIALSALLFGCFDVRTVNVSEDDGGNAGSAGPALLIDDFEDGNRVPSDLQFGPWRCNSYNSSGGSPAKCGVSLPGFNFSKYAYSVDFELADAMNRILDFPGVSLESQTYAPLDVSAYKTIGFSAKLVARDQPLPEPVSIRINLECSTVSQLVPPWTGVFSIGNAVQPTDSWQSFTLAIASFIQFDWNKALIPIDESSCARRVDGIRFEYPPVFADGDATAGTLTIDNVYLQ